MNHYNKVVAVDFDNTLFETVYPRIFDPILPVIDYCKMLQEQGWVLILWTCREGKDLVNAISACERVGLKFDYVNENEPERIKAFGNDSRKIGADFYIDDRALNVNDVPNLKTPCFFIPRGVV